MMARCWLETPTYDRCRDEPAGVEFLKNGYRATAIALAPLIREPESRLFPGQLDPKSGPLIGSASIREPAVVRGNDLP